ncbi:hypothetical protein FRC91_19445 [Bradymonadales bacterium TMQ1]|nr:hypothetical protein FRC91_19445 [Bradymonadales bacterium TMQ1]
MKKFSWRWVLFLIVTVGVVIVGFAMGQGISVANQVALLSHLLTASSIILGVSGIWFGVLGVGIYGDFNKKQKTATQRVADDVFPWLVRLVVYTTLVICFSLVLVIVGEAALNSLEKRFESTIRGLFFGFICALTFWEVVLLAISLLPLSRFRDGIERDKKARNLKEKDQARHSNN